jgi:DNA-binding IclR family transcriptional regulator
MEPESSILTKAFDVLDVFDDDRRVVTLTEIAQRSGLPKSTVHRLLARLLALNVIERHGTGYRVGIRMLSVSSVTPVNALRELALPFLHLLHSRVGNTVHLTVLRGAEIVYVEKIRHPAAFPTPSYVGGHMPAHATAAGKVLLAFTEESGQPPESLARRTANTITDVEALRVELATVRERGIATEFQESAPGIACLAAPITIMGRVFAALSVAVPAARGVTGLEGPVRETSVRIARATAKAEHQDYIPPIT